jgi:hypothetical protein
MWHARGEEEVFGFWFGKLIKYDYFEEFGVNWRLI